jgi:hypothetical protein
LLSYARIYLAGEGRLKQEEQEQLHLVLHDVQRCFCTGSSCSLWVAALLNFLRTVSNLVRSAVFMTINFSVTGKGLLN